MLRLIPSTLRQQRNFAAAASAAKPKTVEKQGRPNIVLVDAVRTPFVQSGTVFKDMMAVDLQREALLALSRRTNVPLSEVEHIICGTVIQECRTSNIAREAALTAGFPLNIPCNTVTLACISSNVAMTNLMDSMQAGHIQVGIAGGVELLSDVPIRYNRNARKAMLAIQKAKTPADKLKLGGEILKNLLAPELPAVAEFTSGETMGTSGDRLAAAFGVSRREQDEFAHPLEYPRRQGAEGGPPQRRYPRFHRRKEGPERFSGQWNPRLHHGEAREAQARFHQASWICHRRKRFVPHRRCFGRPCYD
ncbi:hypothetical protein L596_024935 [Steinernema carpocapsae]|uniref:Thiolase N-terminal domain-containing protein n=1 Tax=Steinernema carpocapsae TaxID=34508 RepID=A0A4U5M6F2_STECR|nr:hypothetical protein L596_024935 [Steinernema carpocapsae]